MELLSSIIRFDVRAILRASEGEDSGRFGAVLDSRAIFAVTQYLFYLLYNALAAATFGSLLPAFGRQGILLM
jgi:hypothetical protein